MAAPVRLCARRTVGGGISTVGCRESVETRSERAQNSCGIVFDRLAMRDDDSPQVAAFRPAPELSGDFALVFSQRELHRPRNVRIIAGESHDPHQPAAEAAFTV